jgi:hypothetical protein
MFSHIYYMATYIPQFLSVVSHTEETAVAEHLRPRTPQPLGSGSAYFSNRSGMALY